MFRIFSYNVLWLSACLITYCLSSCTSGADLWVDATGPSTGDGSADRPFRTIQQAAAIAKPGDKVHVKPGIYRERVMPACGGEKGRPIIYISEKPHAAIVKGSDVFSPKWHEEGRGIFSGEVDNRLFTDNDYVDGGNPYRIAYYWGNSRPPYPFKNVHWTLGQVFVDSQPQVETSSREELAATPNSWLYDAITNRIFLNLSASSPNGRLVEITVRRGVFRPKLKGLGYIEVRGFVFEHCANQFPSGFWSTRPNAQSGMIGTRGGHHWVIANNIIRHAKSIGLSFGTSGGQGPTFDNETPALGDKPASEVGFHRIESNVFYANGALGAMGFDHTDVVFLNNLFLGNNVLANTAYETGGIKTHMAYGFRVEGNWFIDNDCMGLWLDNTWKSARVTRNIFLGNRGEDIFCEMDNNSQATACLVDYNIFLPGRPEFTPAPSDLNASPQPWTSWSVGIYGHDADGIRINHNLFASDGYGLYFRKMTTRKGGAANISATGNLFLSPQMTAVCLPLNNPPVATGNYFESNVYPSGPHPFAVTGWSHPNGKEADTNAVARILSTWKVHGAPGEDPARFPFGDPAKPPVGYFLSQDQWRSVMAFDRDSRSIAIPFSFDRETWMLSLTIPDELSQLLLPKVPGLDRDFFGHPLPDRCLPGPFPALTPGQNRISLPQPPVKILASVSVKETKGVH